jgi:hypothetical protein
MPDTDKSPAVQSLQREQASQRERSSKGALETGLEDSFPASDPVSVTHSSASGGRADVDEAERVLLKHGDEDAVDAARRSTGQDRDAFAGSDPRNRNMRALRRDAAHILETASEVVSGAKALAKAEVRGAMGSIKERIREKPIAAMAVVAALAFIFGATR